MPMHDEFDLLDQAEIEAKQIADEMTFASDVDRRQFVFLSLAAAAATTFGYGSKVLAQGAGGPPGAPGGRGAQGPPVPPVNVDNMEEVSWTFQPYPGGTGDLLNKTYREKGMAAFDRQPFAWNMTTKGAFHIAPFTGNLPATDEEIAFLPAHRLSAAIHAGKLTSTRITKIYLERLKRLNPTLLCAVTILEEQGLADAAKMDAELKAGKSRGPLHGIPWGVKDLFAVKGTPTTWGAADFENRVIDEDSEVVVRLRDAGAVLIAKLASGQFAQGANWFRGTTKDPWNITQSSGGSSAGPGSATGGGCVAFGIGTETSGSIVGPAAQCGISALRPTFGRVSRYGGMVLAWSQDRVGPLTRTAEDAAMVFNVMHGVDAKDPSTITMPFHFNSNIDFASLRLGVRKQNNPDPVFDAFVDKLKSMGAKPMALGDPPNVAGSRGGLDEESAAAFDTYVQMKAKQLNMDMDAIQKAYGRAAGGGRGGAGGGAPAAPALPPGVANGQLNRWVPGRVPTAMDFINSQRRRLMLITAWQDYLKDTDLYIGAADTSVHAQTGHPVTVVQMGFGVRAGRGGGPPGGAGGGRGGRGGADSTAAAPAAPLNPQPICTQIAGNLYNDDMILSFAHKYQINTPWVNERPKLG